MFEKSLVEIVDALILTGHTELEAMLIVATLISSFPGKDDFTETCSENEIFS